VGLRTRRYHVILIAAITLVWSAFPSLPGTTVRAQELPQPPEISAKAAFVRDVSAGVDLYDLNGDDRLSAGSTIKIATAMVARATVDLDDEVVIVESDPVEEGYSTMELLVGDTLTVEQLLLGLLIPSGGDAAQAIARYAGANLLGLDPETVDPQQATARFVEEMNALARDLGLENTQFVNPDGRDAADQYTSARDLTTIAAEFMQDETLREIVAMPNYEFVSPGGNTYAKPNTNELLAEPGVIGIKTGSETQAGACLVLASKFGANEVITVVLGSDLAYDEATSEKTVDRRYDDARSILAGLDADYRWVAVDDPSAVPGLEDALFAWQVTMREGPELVMPTAGDDDLTFRLRLGAPGEPEQEVGRVLFFAGSTQVGERPLFQATAAQAERSTPIAA
jgi:D-alanyl-D-alanine carboxypeptidase (penicillin-binding protein 5/6)